MVMLTEAAVSTLELVLAGSVAAAAGVRIAAARDRTGVKYMMGLEADARVGDTVIEAGQIKVFIDDQSQFFLLGVTVDYVESDRDSGFRFDKAGQGSCECSTAFGDDSCATEGACGPCGTSRPARA